MTGAWIYRADFMIQVGMWTPCGLRQTTGPLLFECQERPAAGHPLCGRRRFRTADIRLVRSGVSTKTGHTMTASEGRSRYPTPCLIWPPTRQRSIWRNPKGCGGVDSAWTPLDSVRIDDTQPGPRVQHLPHVLQRLRRRVLVQPGDTTTALMSKDVLHRRLRHALIVQP